MQSNLKKDFEDSFLAPAPLDNFNVTLFRAMKKADKDNLLALEKAFPEHYKVFDGWKRFGLDYTSQDLVIT